MLREYLKFAEKGHEPQSMRAALAIHDTFLKKGDMRLTDFVNKLYSQKKVPHKDAERRSN